MVVNDYFYLHHLLGEWSKMLLTTIHYEGEILRLPSARLLIAYDYLISVRLCSIPILFLSTVMTALPIAHTQR